MSNFTQEDARKLPVLRRGDSSPHVVTLKSILRSQGMWDGTNSPDFGPKLDSAVRYYQSTHLGPTGQYLKGDGVVGEGTWWSLYNASGPAQKSFIKPPAQEKRTPDHIPAFDHKYGRLSLPRQKFLRVLFNEHAAGTREIPDGSNQGDGVDKYIKGYGPVYWCALAQSWCWKEANGDWPRGTREAGVLSWWRKALAGGYAHKVNSGYVPVPGDLAIWSHGKGAGHVSAVVASTSELKFNTIGGNEGNRMKLGLRDTDSEPQLLGWIDIAGDGPSLQGAYTGGLLPVDTKAQARLGLANTR